MRDTSQLDDESDFQSEYRETAREWAGYAILATAIIYLSIFAVSWYTEPYTTVVLAVRLSIVAVLLFIGLLLLFRRQLARDYYGLIGGLGSAVALGGVVLLFALPHFLDSAPVVSASPSIIFGLLLHYAFLRLPLLVAGLIGIVISVASFYWVPIVSGGNEDFRTVVFLTCTNGFGLTWAWLVERRERELHKQRRLAERAHHEAAYRREMAEASDRQKTRLIAAISHDLRQPMTAAAANLEVLSHRLQRGDVIGAQTCVGKAHASVEILGATLEHLLTAARYDSGTEALAISPVQLRGLFADLYEIFVADAESKGVRLRFRLPVTSVCAVTDERSLHRVLSNLISNAIKFSSGRENAEVLVAARVRRDGCRIDVFDNGVGIPPTMQNEIWKPYVQLNNADRDRQQGLGLGLYLVKRILGQLPEHDVRLRSTPGHGSCFTVTLPAGVSSPMPMNAADAASSAADVSLLRGAYILVLEDDKEVREAIGDLLADWQVVTESSASLSDLMGRELDVDRTVDAIVCDYKLQGDTNGLGAVFELRKKLGYSPPSILITGEADVESLIERAAVDVTILRKPFAPAALAVPLVEAVRRPRIVEQS